MAPKKKANKKGNDDWEAELGESVEPIATAAQEAKDAEMSNQTQEEERAGGGGLLAAIQKNKSKKKKKGVVVEDHVDGEPGPELNGTNEDGANDELDLATKAPEEATTDDLFASAPVKGRGNEVTKQGKGNWEEKIGNEVEDEEDDGSKMKSKKEKEKEKKEREKQRKKEQVNSLLGRLHNHIRVAKSCATRCRLQRKKYPGPA